jgi:hypothetical protein
VSSDQQKRPARPTPKSLLSAPFLWGDWACQWIAYWAGSLAIFRVLEYAGKLTVLIALIVWITEIPERRQAGIRTAWSVVNAKGGGRKEALEFLTGQRADLRGLYGAGGFFGGIVLKDRDLRWAELTDANFDGANLEGANFEGSHLSGASFKNANLTNANFRNSRLSSADPTTDFENSKIDGADFRGIAFPAFGSAYLMKSFASARGWVNARFDDDVRKEIP